jgi:hypothetical protein
LKGADLAGAERVLPELHHRGGELGREAVI